MEPVSMKDLADRIAMLEGTVTFLQRVVAQTLNAMPAKERAAALDAVNRSGRPIGEPAVGFSKAMAMLGREVQR